MPDTKISDTVFEVEKVTPAKTEKVQYDYLFLQSQKINIAAQRKRDNDLRDAELAEVNNLIAKAEALGITKPEDLK